MNKNGEIWANFYILKSEVYHVTLSFLRIIQPRERLLLQPQWQACPYIGLFKLHLLRLVQLWFRLQL